MNLLNNAEPVGGSDGVRFAKCGRDDYFISLGDSPFTITPNKRQLWFLFLILLRMWLSGKLTNPTGTSLLPVAEMAEVISKLNK